MRKLGVAALLLAGIALTLAPQRRAKTARRLALAKQFVSRRIVDRTARTQDLHAPMS